MKKYYLPIGLTLVFTFIVLIGPWPVIDDDYHNSKYATETYEHIKKLAPISESGDLQAGVASVDITPDNGVPLAGYSAREPKANKGVLDRVYAKAVTLTNGNHQVTLLTAEILLPLPELVESVLKKTKLARNELYFTSTHTHSGPGGYAHGLIESFAVGEFDKNYFEFLSEQLAKAVNESKINMQAVSLHYQRFQLAAQFQQTYIFNQLNNGPNAHGSIHILQFVALSTQKPIATLVTFSAHPTLLGRINMKVSGDYPGVLTRKLSEQIPGEVLFMIGGVGGMLPVGEKIQSKSELEIQKSQMRDLGERLANTIVNVLNNKNPTTEIDRDKTIRWEADSAIIQSEIIPVKLPVESYRISDSIRFSPIFVDTIFHNRDTFVQVLKIGKLDFLLFPADFSGELAMQLEHWAVSRNIYPISNSFNGDYIGYLTPSNRYDIDSHITHDDNFYGRWSGDYMLEVSKKIIEQLNN